MNKKELGSYLWNSVKSKYPKSSEWRDYHKIESKDPERFKGYGKRNGIMILVDVNDNDLYIDINILEKTFRMKFRNDDDSLISATKNIEDSSEEFIDVFFTLVDEYQTSMNRMYKRFSEFNKGVIPEDLGRERKIDKITDEICDSGKRI